MTAMRRERTYIEVVPPMLPGDAERRFQRWLKEHALAPDELQDDDVLIDAIRALDGRSLRRYWVKRSLLHDRRVVAAGTQSRSSAGS